MKHISAILTLFYERTVNEGLSFARNDYSTDISGHIQTSCICLKEN